MWLKGFQSDFGRLRRRQDAGRVAQDQTEGFHYLLCFCPAFDASEGIFPVIDGVCGQFDDFMQQASGVLEGLARPQTALKPRVSGVSGLWNACVCTVWCL